MSEPQTIKVFGQEIPVVANEDQLLELTGGTGEHLHLVPRVDDPGNGTMSPALTARRLRVPCETCGHICWYDPDCMMAPEGLTFICIQCLVLKMKELAPMPEGMIRPAHEVLPRLGWQGREALSLERFEPVTLSIGTSDINNKPANGGLFASPMVEIDGECWGTMFTGAGYQVWSEDRPLWEVLPHADARVLVIDTFDDVMNALKRWPDPRSVEDAMATVLQSSIAPSAFDWVKMSTEVDVFYLTANAADKVRFSGREGGANFYGWDAATALFLNATFTPGGRLESMLSVRERERRSEEAFERMVAKVLAEHPEMSEQDVRTVLTAMRMGLYNPNEDADED